MEVLIEHTLVAPFASLGAYTGKNTVAVCVACVVRRLFFCCLLLWQASTHALEVDASKLSCTWLPSGWKVVSVESISLGAFRDQKDRRREHTALMTDYILARGDFHYAMLNGVHRGVRSSRSTTKLSIPDG